MQKRNPCTMRGNRKSISCRCSALQFCVTTARAEATESALPVLGRVIPEGPNRKTQKRNLISTALCEFCSLIEEGCAEHFSKSQVLPKTSVLRVGECTSLFFFRPLFKDFESLSFSFMHHAFSFDLVGPCARLSLVHFRCQEQN